MAGGPRPPYPVLIWDRRAAHGARQTKTHLLNRRGRQGEGPWPRSLSRRVGRHKENREKQRGQRRLWTADGALVNRLHAGGLSPSAIQVTLLPVRAIYRQHRDDIPINPCEGLDLPAIRGRREKIADPREAVKLIAALPESDRALWATAFYGGLRRGELQGLRWEDVDLAAGVIRVERGWDVVDGAIEPKSSAGRRRVPIPVALRDHLIAHKLATGGEGIVFTRSDPDQPFSSVASQKRADKAWRAAGLGRLTLHECRHSYASFMIDAGVNSKALQTMGHSSITVTLDLYGHLLPGSEAEAAALADTYLQAQEDRDHDQARAADPTGADTGASLALTADKPLDQAMSEE